MNILTIPSVLKISSSNEIQIQLVVIGRDQFRPGQKVEVRIGKEVVVWNDRGSVAAVVTRKGLVVKEEDNDESR